MKKNKILLLIIISIISRYGLAEDKSKFKIELDFNNEVSFGVDEINRVNSYVSPILKTVLYREAKDFVPNDTNNSGNSNNTGNNSGNSSNSNEVKPYKPNISEEKRDAELAFKYLSRIIKKKKDLNLKLSSDLIGLSGYMNFKNTKYNSNNIFDFDKVKVGVNFDKPYFYADIHSYLKGESSKKYGIENLDREKEQKNKEITYNFMLSPLYNKEFSPMIEVNGIDDYAKITPSFKIEKNNFYFKSGLVFRAGNDKKEIDINEEIMNLKHTAPGYDKVEYFKNWTLKKDIPENLTFEEDKANLDKAEVSGYKGTSRLLGLPSGSLYGDFPLKFVLREFIALTNDPEFSIYGNLLNIVRNPKINIEAMKLAIKNKELIDKAPKFIDTLVSNLYEKTGVAYDPKTSSISFWNAVPEEFIDLAMIKNKKFNLENYSNLDKLDPNYLYYGIKKPILNIDQNRSSNNTTGVSTFRIAQSQNKYNLINRGFYIKDDVKYYVEDQILKSDLYKEDIKSILKIKKDFENAKLEADSLKKCNWNDLICIGKGIYGTISEGISGVGSITKLSTENIVKVLDNPYTMKEIDMFRGIYIHNSEKGKKEYELSKKLEKVLKDVENKAPTKKNNALLNFEAGYEKDGYKFKVNTLLNDGYEISGNNYKFIKNSHNFGLHFSKNALINKNNRMYFGSDLGLEVSNNYFKKDENNMFKYRKYDLDMFNRFIYNTDILNDVELQLGIDHIGKLGYIKDPHIFIDGKEYETDIAVRDENNNPKTKDGKFINVKEHTEKELVDKAMGLSNGKVERDVIASDYIEKEKSKAKSSIYKAYNIVNPNISLINKYSDNLIITNRIDLPLAFEGRKISGFNPSYKNNIKYILDDKDIRRRLLKGQALNITNHGIININYDKDKYLDYDLLFDADLASLNVYGTNKNLDFNLKLNPLIIDLGVNPEIVFNKEDKDYSMKIGVNSKFKQSTVSIGMKRGLFTTKDYYKDNIKDPILEILNDRSKDEYNIIKPLLTDDYTINPKNLEFKPTLYLEAKKDAGKLKYSVSLESTLVSNESTKENKEILKEDKDYILKKDGIDGKNYIIYGQQYLKNKGYFDDVNALYVYKLNKEKVKVEKNNILQNKFSMNKYDFNSNFNLINEKGFNFSNKFEINNENAKLKIYKISNIKEFKDIIKESYIIMGNFNNSTGYNLKEDKYLIKVNNGEEVVKIFKEKLNPSKDLYRDNKKNKLNEKKVKEYKKLLKEEFHEEKNLEKINKESFSVETNKFNFETKNDLSYNVKSSDNLTFNIGAESDIAVNVLEMKALKLDGNVLYGSRKINVKNILTPNVGIKYNFMKGANLNLGIGTPIKMPYHNLKDKLSPVKLKVNLNYEY